MILIAIPLYLLLALGLSILTDGVFSNLLDNIGIYYNIPSNLVAATLMAMASSAPEFATSLVDTFWFKNQIGIGTIIGSAIFNLLVIIALSGLFAEKNGILISKKYIIRDMTFYLFTISILVLIVIDGKLTQWNMWVLTSCYIYYIFYIYYQFITTPNTHNRFQSKRNWKTIILVLKAKQNFKKPINKRIDTQLSLETDPRSPQIKTNTDTHIIDIVPLINKNNINCIKPKTIIIRISEFLYNFWEIIFKHSVSENRFILGFISCCFWIVSITYVLVWCCNIFSDKLNISPIITGLLILAPTTSLPDMMASIMLANRGEGSSAISNAIGSNIFDISIGYGLPKLLYTIIYGIQFIKVNNSGIRSLITLIISIIITIFSFNFNKWKLDRKIGIILFIAYLIYLIVEIYYLKN